MDTRSFERAVAAGLGTWPAGTVFLAAVSGGADSTAMLAALAALRRDRRYKLYCLHVEHGIRPAGESRGDAEAVRAFCERLDVPCRLVFIAPGRVAETARERGSGMEGAARIYRHAAWNREARRIGAARILVAHTRDDLFETVIMRFLRGAGPAGLAALPRERGGILRPLLALSRRDVLGYLGEREIPFRTDSTNADNTLLRNRIRNRLIPRLDILFPHWRNSLITMAETQRMAADFLGEEARKRLPWRPMTRGAASLRVSREAFFSQPEILREEALFIAVDQLKKHRPPGDRFSPDEGPPGAAGPDSGPGTPRRAALRLFARGTVPALDLGAFRLEGRGAFIEVSRRIAPLHGEGFSLLINEPGLYKLKGLTIECTAFVPREREKEGFFAGLPLVFRGNFKDDCITKAGTKRPVSKILDKSLRSRYTGIISAADAKGEAAFIALGDESAILLRREEQGGEPPGAGFFFTVIGGIDVQRSE
ncbi:MAG: tRNA lysidine(34) synthetase TilS [Spirochaetaceae bacterium]|jgi:tRNA(Ile)-lysidine synthase|nr:tRNA lysidine(34) synthetase TilS [Spirochaetaceae bacterium]